MLKPSKSYTPEVLERMAAAYQNAVKELGLEKAASCERERLASYILSIGNSVKDANRMLDRAVRMYQRGASYSGYRQVLGDALASQFKSADHKITQDNNLAADPQSNVLRLSEIKTMHLTKRGRAVQLEHGLTDGSDHDDAGWKSRFRR